MKKLTTKIETTNTVYGCLEQGGVSGRVVSYDASLISDIMECTPEEASEMDGEEMVPGLDGINLWQYLNHHNPPCHVIRKGHIIQ